MSSRWQSIKAGPSLRALYSHEGAVVRVRQYQARARKHSDAQASALARCTLAGRPARRPRTCTKRTRAHTDTHTHRPAHGVVEALHIAVSAWAHGALIERVLHQGGAACKRAHVLGVVDRVHLLRVCQTATEIRRFTQGGAAAHLDAVARTLTSQPHST